MHGKAEKKKMLNSKMLNSYFSMNTETFQSSIRISITLPSFRISHHYTILNLYIRGNGHTTSSII